ncbi:XdhC family protein [Ferviditalea candida]|uniref:XdhC family protein n=1 Tax=Ferviditalea candida TaxID=3108399 RepID=A0ABU5ZFW3_9BACL|nr:XdhC family protein [Paenibacillaceae bacterium T2]
MPFAVVTVVRSAKPTSAVVGSKALVYPNGQMFGFVGGHCTQSLVVSQALECIETGESRLLLITSDESQIRVNDGVTVMPMTCHSEGTVELFIEPKLPAPTLLVIGDSPIAKYLLTFGEHMNFNVKSLSLEQISKSEAPDVHLLKDKIQQILKPGSYVVIATMGVYDEESIRALAGIELSYAGLITSPKRKAKVLDWIKDQGLSAQFSSFISAPAGLDLGAVEPSEIAITILAEIIQYRRQKKRPAVKFEARITERNEAIDPVCHMVVDMDKTLFKTEYQGKEYGFCCPHCRQAFLKDPDSYVKEVNV